MKKKSFQIAAMCCMVLCTTQVFAQTKPNLLVIITDQQRFDMLGRMQTELGIPAKSRVKTPNLDKLSQDGAYFRNAYTHCAVCVPARTSFLTGCITEHTGVRTNSEATMAGIAGKDAEIKIPGMRTYDMILVKDFGYVAEYYGKWHSPEVLGYVYSNDVRMAGVSSAWFGKYETDGTTKHISVGLSDFFRQWLGDNKIPETAPVQGQQTCTYTARPYVPDPLDSRFGMAPGTTVAGESDQHGRDLCPNGFSSTGHDGVETLEALDRLSKTGKPFSLTVSFHFPHPPFVATEKYHSMYNPDSLKTPVSIGDLMVNSAYAGGRTSIDPGYHDPVKIRRWMANYYGLVTEIDEWVGKIFARLDSLNLSDNTMVVFMSDHGEMMGSHGLRSKNIFYEESAHVPFLLRMPGKIPAGVVVEDPITNIDLHATCLDYLGIKGNYTSDGKSLRRYIEGTASSDEYIVTVWNSGSGPAFMIRMGDWKLMVPSTAASTTLDMMFNIKDDPFEMNNFVGKNGATASNAAIGKAEHLKALLVEYLTQMKHPAMSEIKNRRKWKTVDLWVSDTMLDFGTVLRGKTKTASLYLGRTITGSVAISSIEISGSGAANYKIDWTNGTIAGGAQQIVKVTYTDPGTGTAAGNARITINHNAAGAARTVTLVSPKVITVGTGKAVHGLSRAPGSLTVTCNRNGLDVNDHIGTAWKISIQTLNGQVVQRFSGKGSARISFRPTPGMYLIRKEFNSALLTDRLIIQ